LWSGWPLSTSVSESSKCRSIDTTVKRAGRPVEREILTRPNITHSSHTTPPAPNTSSSQAARRAEKKDETHQQPTSSSPVSPQRVVESNGATVKQLASVSGAVGRSSTIVARGQLDGVRCVDMLIDTGASCCFVRRSCAERMKLQQVPLRERVTVTLADRRTAVSTHEVRVKSMSVHGSKAACSLLVMDELSNDVIVGLNWQRVTGLTITPGEPHDLLNGQPVHSNHSNSKPSVVDEEWPRDKPVRLSAALIYAAATAVASRGTESLSAASLDMAATGNSQLRQVLQRHSRVFTDVLPVKTAEQIAQSKQFSIVLIGDFVRPVKQRERRVSPAEIEAATQWVNEEVAAGRMEPSSSEWAAQLVIVPKRNEKGEVSGWRICGDYRNLNAVTKADAEPLPLMQTVFDQLAGMKYFSKLDLLKGFNQIPVEAKSRELMAVSTPAGLYQPTVMPFGVKNAPGSFQREMRRVLSAKLNKGVYVFIDDIIVYSRTEKEHIELIDWVLSRIEAEAYYAHPKKCEFLKDEVNFLGHVVGRAGVSMQQHKVEAISKWPVLQSVKDVRAFLGLAGFYRRFVQGFSRIAQPLTNLTQVADGKWWSWGSDEQKAFDALKRALTNAPVLAHPDPHRQWTVQSDASGIAIGAVLSQKQDDDTMRPVAFWSQKLNSAERNYSATERELMAIVKATEHWRAYLHGSSHPILLKSDHKPLIYLNGKAELGMRLSRWMEALCDLTFEIGYVKGKDNAAADALSRRSDHEPNQVAAEPSMWKVKLTSITRGQPVAHPWRAHGSWMEAPRVGLAPIQPVAQQPQVTETQLQVESLLADMRAAAGQDKKYQTLLKGDEPQDGLQRRDGLVYSRSGAVYVPNDKRLKTRLLELAHDAVGHFGRARTVERLSRHCVWTGMTSEVEDYCRSCAVCAVSKGSNAMPAGKLVPMPIPERVWDSVGVDFTGPLPVTANGNDSIMAIVDRFSKMLTLKACKTTITGIESGRLLLDQMLGMGRIPTSIVSDRDVRFTGAAWGQLWRGLKTEQKMSTSYHPQTDGQTERANRTLQAVLRAYAESRTDWDEWLSFVAAAYNSTVQESTGRTPFEMNFADARAIDPLQWAIDGRDNVRASDRRGVSAEAERTLTEMKVIWDEVRAKLVVEQARQKKYADTKRREVKYEVGDRVYLSTRNLNFKTFGGKLLARWVGPYLVTEVRRSGVSVKLDLRGELGKTNPVFHVSHLKPYEVSELEWPGRQQHHRPAPELVDGETEWEVELVVGKKIEMQKMEVTKIVEAPASGGRALRKRPPQEVKVIEEVPVVWYKLRWKGYEEETWQRESDCHCSELIEAFELLQRQKEQEETVGSGVKAASAMELGVATVVEWWLTDKSTTSRRGKPTVRCSYASVQALKSGPVCSGAVLQQQSAVQRPGTSVSAA
jgi:predicted aspartyl protease/transposase InsO family protein